MTGPENPITTGQAAYEATIALRDELIAGHLQTATEALAPALGSEAAAAAIGGLFEAVKLEIGKVEAAERARVRANNDFVHATGVTDRQLDEIPVRLAQGRVTRGNDG